MEYGLVSKLDQFTDNRALEVQKVQSSNSSSELKARKDLEQIQQETIVKAKETSELQSVKNEQKAPAQKYEVVLSNLNFGFNDSSKDFFVKVERGNVENQYPTQEMMKMKAYMMSLNEDISAS